MFLHTNLLGQRVVLAETEDVPAEYANKHAIIRSVYLHPETGTPRYTLSVQFPDRPLREVWDCEARHFGMNK